MASAVRWTVEVSDVTDALSRGREEDEDGDVAEPVVVSSRAYASERAARKRVDDFACGLRDYMVLEHVDCADEVYLRCIGRRARDAESRSFEVIARRS